MHACGEDSNIIALFGLVYDLQLLNIYIISETSIFFLVGRSKSEDEYRQNSSCKFSFLHIHALCI